MTKPTQTRSKIYAYSWGLSFVIGCYLTSCDPERKTKCEWFLTPNPKADYLTEPGMVSVCLSNFQLGRQRCYFVATPQTVKDFNGIAFVYEEVEHTTDFPRRITKLTACKGS